MDWHALPGGELVAEGISDLAAGRDTLAAALVSIGSPRLRALGIELPQVIAQPEHHLYDLLVAKDARSAHGRYNALVRRLVSFERAAACVRV